MVFEQQPLELTGGGSTINGATPYSLYLLGPTIRWPLQQHYSNLAVINILSGLCSVKLQKDPDLRKRRIHIHIINLTNMVPQGTKHSLFRKLHTVKTVANSCKLQGQLPSVKTTAHSCTLSRQLKIVADLCRHVGFCLLNYMVTD